MLLLFTITIPTSYPTIPFRTYHPKGFKKDPAGTSLVRKSLTVLVILLKRGPSPIYLLILT